LDESLWIAEILHHHDARGIVGTQGPWGERGLAQ